MFILTYRVKHRLWLVSDCGLVIVPEMKVLMSVLMLQ